MAGEVQATEWVWLDGEWVPAADARLPAFHHGVGVADGLYETWRTHGSSPGSHLPSADLLSLHLVRLVAGCSLLALDGQESTRLKPDLLARICGDLLERNELSGRDAKLRLVVLRKGTAAVPGRPDPVAVAVYAQPVAQDVLDARRARGLRLALFPPTRVPGDPFHQIKHLGGLQTQAARLRCVPQGVDDVLFQNARGEICEAGSANVFLVHPGNRIIQTPPVESPCLPGITRACVLRLARESGYEVREAPVSAAVLLAASEVFVTSSVSEVMPVVEIDGSPVGDGRPGPTALRMQEKIRP